MDSVTVSFVFNLNYSETIKLVLKYECWDFRDKKSSPAAGEVVTVPVKNYNTFDKAIIVHRVQGVFFTLGLPQNVQSTTKLI